MNWKDKAIGLHKRFGAPAKFAAKMILGAVLPGGSVVVELVGEALDCAHETAKDNLAVEKVSKADLQRVEEVLGVLANELNPLMAQMTALADLPDRAAQLLEVAMATDEHFQHALHRLDHLARSFDRLEEQNKRLLEGQGFAASMLAEILPLMRRMVGVADYIEDLRTAGVSATAFRSGLHEFQGAAQAFLGGRIAEAGARFQKVAQSQPRSAAAAAALAGAKAIGQDFLAAEQSIARAARLRPDDPDLAELHRRVTVASRGATPREKSASREASQRPPKAGDTLDGWRLELLLGHGGWGRVFKAGRGSESRALKVMHPDLSHDPLFVERFKKEIMTLASLRGHKHLVAIDNFGYAAEASCWYFLMEFIEGTSLERYLQKRGALKLAHARPLFLALADGLETAHARGIIHRDIKPTNILLRRNGAPVLVDFGLAAVDDDKGMCQTGRSAGFTAMFAAPEQLRGKQADARSDIYSLAASLYYALVYDKPDHREPYRFEAEQVPEALREFLTLAMHPKPECRPQSISEFREVLRATKSLRRTVEFLIPGSISSRRADDPEAEWKTIVHTPATITVDRERVYQLFVNADATNDQFATLAGLPGLINLQEVCLWRCRQLTYGGFTQLRVLASLQSLDLSECKQLTDLAYLSDLVNLQELKLSKCKLITDASLSHLRGLVNLRKLELDGCKQVTNEGLSHLSPLCNLRWLNLADASKLQMWVWLNCAGLPACKLYGWTVAIKLRTQVWRTYADSRIYNR